MILAITCLLSCYTRLILHLPALARNIESIDIASYFVDIFMKRGPCMVRNSCNVKIRPIQWKLSMTCL